DWGRMKAGVDYCKVALMACGPQMHQAVNLDLHHVVDEKPYERIAPQCQRIGPSQRRHAPSVDRGQGSDDLGCFAGNDQAPIGPRPLPKRSHASRDVNGEVPGDQQLEKDEALNDGPGEEKVFLCDPEKAECRDNSHHAEHRADREYAFHVPAHRAWSYDGVVVGDHHDREVVEDCDEHDHDRGYRVEVEHHNRERHEEQDTDGFRNPVDCVAVHAFEYLARFCNGSGDYRETFRREHQIRGRTSGVGRAAYRDAAISLFERGRVVDAVTGHSDDMSTRLKGLDDLELMLRKNLCVAVGRVYLVTVVRLTVGKKIARNRDVRSQLEFARYLARYCEIVAGYHAHLQPHFSRGRDGRG